MQLDLFGNLSKDRPAEGKTCSYCGEYKAYTYFPRHISFKDNHDNRCKSCKNGHDRLRDEIRKTAPPKTNNCQCCGLESNDIVLDHCHDTNKFRGWICRNCNAGIGHLKDNIEGLEKAIAYLRKYYG